MAWSSQAQGFLSGRYQEHDRSDSEMVRVWYSPDNFDRLRRVNELADRHGVSPIAVALAWVLALPFPSFAIIGPRSLRELYTSAGALRLTLSESEVEWLRHG
ncbi:MAG: aldo/keto reductase [Chloroflexi bacterium]|nr:aldo/keto reductase [Chloroflexota bacterium]